MAGCGSTHPLVKNCVDTTPAMSSARWSCIQDANAQIYGNRNNQPATQQAPAYDPFRVPTTNLTPGLTGGNQGMTCTPDGRGGYNCR